jgi:hypothetical protein
MLVTPLWNKKEAAPGTLAVHKIGMDNLSVGSIFCRMRVHVAARPHPVRRFVFIHAILNAGILVAEPASSSEIP